jgi:hypothetical protein
MSKPTVPTFENELAYAVESFEDENDRKPTEAELSEIKAEVQDKVAEAQEAYDEYAASGAFTCAVCDQTHHHWAPKPCRDAYNSEHF